MFQEPISGLLSDLRADGIFGLLRFLEELGDLLEGGVRFLLFSFGILDILEKQSVSFIVYLLGRSLGMCVHVFFKRAQPVNLLS